jgi:hypothetical protein
MNRKLGWPVAQRLTVFVLVSLLIVLVMPTFWRAPVQTLAQTPSPKTTKAGDVVTSWNVTALNVTQTASTSAPLQFRALAITHAAIFDAVNAINRRYNPYVIDVKAPQSASVEAAAAAAAHSALSRLYPAQQTTLDAALKETLAKVPDGQSKEDGVKVGQAVAEKLIELRSKDGWDAKIDYKPGTGLGVWQPTPPGYAAAVLTQVGKMTPFTLKSANQIKIPAPLDFKSAAYIKDLNEVKTVGAKKSKTRGADQTAAAIFWTTQTASPWNAAARAAAATKNNGILENARLFALLNLAATDAYIAGYYIKYQYNVWRPITAIREASKIGSLALSADPKWEPLIITPPHPDYVSGHCVSTAAAERILQDFFGNDTVTVSETFPPKVGVTRTYTSFSQMSKEVEDARVWGGVHTRTADVRGTELGHQVADYVFKTFLRPV